LVDAVEDGSGKGPEGRLRACEVIAGQGALLLRPGQLFGSAAEDFVQQQELRPRRAASEPRAPPPPPPRLVAAHLGCLALNGCLAHLGDRFSLAALRRRRCRLGGSCPSPGH
jgi:hypothetical protein